MFTSIQPQDYHLLCETCLHAAQAEDAAEELAMHREEPDLCDQCYAEVHHLMVQRLQAEEAERIIMSLPLSSASSARAFVTYEPMWDMIDVDLYDDYMPAC